MRRRLLLNSIHNRFFAANDSTDRYSTQRSLSILMNSYDLKQNAQFFFNITHLTTRPKQVNHLKLMWRVRIEIGFNELISSNFQHIDQFFMQMQ